MKQQRCPRCGEKTDALYSPDWVCLNCIPKEQLNQYPEMKKLKRQAQEGK